MPVNYKGTAFRAGDELSLREVEFLHLLNAYRAKHNLPEVAPSLVLSTTANRHGIDQQENIGLDFYAEHRSYTMHNWSDAPVTNSRSGAILPKSNWDNDYFAPQRIGFTDFTGYTYENTYRSWPNSPSATDAIEGWKSSHGHNILMLNLEGWKPFTWQSVGVAFHGNFANLRFSDMADPRGGPKICGTSEADKFMTFAANDRVFGFAGNDTIDGRRGNDIIDGGAGDDALKGGAGDDTLKGGTGKDTLQGQGGADTFDFNSIGESLVGKGHDVVTFSSKDKDKIDLSSIDADQDGAAGDQAFLWIGAGKFSGIDGQLRFSKGLLQGDVNGDKVADFEIQIKGSLGLADLIL